MLLKVAVRAALEHIVLADILAGTQRAGAVIQIRSAQVGLVVIHGDVRQAVAATAAYICRRYPAELNFGAWVRGRDRSRAGSIRHTCAIST